MNLEDLYKSSAKAPQFEVKRTDGTDSGHNITLKPAGDEGAAVALMRYLRLLKLMGDKFESENLELKAECEAAKDFSEYNFKLETALASLKKAFARELVTGWDFDNEFTKEALDAALGGFPGLASQIIDAHFDEIEAHQKK
jgi:hypothetical protein